MPLLRVGDELAGGKAPQVPGRVVRVCVGRGAVTPSAYWRELDSAPSPRGSGGFEISTIDMRSRDSPPLGRAGGKSPAIFPREPSLPGSDGGIQLAGGRGAFLWLEVALCHRSASPFLQRRAQRVSLSAQPPSSRGTGFRPPSLRRDVTVGAAAPRVLGRGGQAAPGRLPQQ